MIKIGMVGMNQGNAHPISWSSIINGIFDGQLISEIGYPAVSAYLTANRDTLGIREAAVTHLWTQDAELSAQIAKCCGIVHCCRQLEDMISEVDAVIIARDDAEHHRELAEPFLNANIPVFIDKPLAINREDLTWFQTMHSAGKFIMSCSSTRYAGECRTLKAQLPDYGKLEFITCVGKNDWAKYGIHRLESVFSLLDDPTAESIQALGDDRKELMCIRFKDGLLLTIHLSPDVVGTAQFSVFGKNKWSLVEVTNSYAMFRQNIVEFVRSVEEGSPRLDFKKTYNLIHTLIGGIESRRDGGKIIKL